MHKIALCLLCIMYIMPLTYLYFTYIFPTCSKAIGLIAKTYSYIPVKKREASAARSLPLYVSQC